MLPLLSRSRLFFLINTGLGVFLIFFAATAQATNTFPASGNVGIGTTSPAYELDVVGDVQTESVVIDGVNALSLSTSLDSVYVGTASASATGGKNTFVGTGVGSVTTTGNENTALGYWALKDNTEGRQNVALGIETLNKNTTGSHNVAIGRRALYSNQTGTSNTAVGTDALISNTSGNFNTAVGNAALLQNTTGSFNTAVGRLTLANNTGGSNNTALGGYALHNNTSGNGNLAFGENALEKNTTGGSNLALGGNALKENISGGQNIAMGFSSQSAGTTSLRNISLGSYSFLNLNGNDNIGLGYQVGYGLTSGNANILLGSYAGNDLTTGSNNIIIGHDLDALTATTSHHLNIGGTLYGDLAAGKIGIGTASPLGVFQVNYPAGNTDSVRFYSPLQNAEFNQIKFGYGDGGSKEVAMRYTRDDTNGDVFQIFHLGDTGGVNIHEGDRIALGLPLEVTGQGFFTTTRHPLNPDADVHIQDFRDSEPTRLLLEAAANGGSEIHFGDFYDADVGRLEYDHTVDAFIFTTNNAEGVRIDAAGNMGIGTANPTQKLEVAGTVTATAFVGDGSGLTGISGGSSLWTENNGNVHRTTGSVGIGTASPAERLQVSNAVRSTGSAYDFAAGPPGISMDWAAGVGRIGTVDGTGAGGDLVLITNSTEKMRVKTNGSLGIGTTSPAERLEVVNAIRSTGSAYDFAGGNPGVSIDWAGGVGRIGTVNGTGVGGDLVFITNSGENMRLKTDGKLGIGTTTPTETLEVAGTVKATAFVGDGSGLTGLPSGGSSLWGETSGNVHRATGNVGVGTTTPSEKLEVAGSIKLTNNGSLTSDGELCIGSGC